MCTESSTIPEGKYVFSIRSVVRMGSPGMANHLYQLSKSNLRILFPDASEGPTL